MEGLLIDELLRRLAALLPAERLPWSFPSEREALLPLRGNKSLYISSDPQNPLLTLTPKPPPGGPPRTPFQEQLRARAAGPLIAAHQLKLDRVFRLEFGEAGGFAPLPAVTLVVELTGRNANLILLGERETILGVERPIFSSRNRYRELRPQLAYVPPPPYEKLDPRALDAAAIGEAIAGAKLEQVGRLIDGIGPELGGALTRAVLARARLSGEGDQGGARNGEGRGGGLTGKERLTGELLKLTAACTVELVNSPSAFLVEHGGTLPEETGGPERRESALAAARFHLGDELELAKRRVRDAERALAAAADAERLREEADLLLAYQHLVRRGANSAELPSFTGESVTLTLDPSVDAATNARRRYDRARRREARAERARAQLTELTARQGELEERLAELPELRDEELDRLAAEARQARARRREKSGERPPGIRYTDPRGFEVVVGRNARDNDRVTFRLARSRDVWLHAQGYRGSHVIIRANGKEVPFETVLFAARLAAGHSEAFRSSNVPVDYTERKNVWRARGAPPGAVQFTQQRTVYVNPARSGAAAASG